LQSYLVSYPQTVWEMAKAPVEWDSDAWIAAGGAVLAAGSLYLVDEQLRDIFQENRAEWSDGIMTATKQFGEGKYLFPVIGGTILAGYLADSDKTMDTGLLCLKSALLAGCASQVLQAATQRQRPNAELGKEFWNAEGFSLDRAFPSGHTTLVWSVAPILAHQYADKGWVGPLAYAIAALTSYSRLNDDKHWASDVFCGALLGYATAQVTLRTTPRLSVSPDLILQGVSFNLDF
jgi:membrane-associated phospholipid phosphatase